MGTSSRSLGTSLVLAVATAAAAACYMGSGVDPSTQPQPPNNYTPVGLDCNVASAMNACVSCHGATPSAGAPMSLTSDTALKAISPLGGTYAERSVLRMQDTKSPMPPGGASPTQAQDLAALQKWIADGYPAGTCSQTSDAGVIIYPTVCTSGKKTIGEDLQNRELMHPGGACNACHASQGGADQPPIYAIAGTVFTTLHEQDDCNAAPIAGTTVVITGADKKVTTLAVNAVGNFLTTVSVAKPYTAKVVRGGKEHAMVGAQTSGDCNSCHTEQGNSGAPGRITAP